MHAIDRMPDRQLKKVHSLQQLWLSMLWLEGGRPLGALDTMSSCRRLCEACSEEFVTSRNGVGWSDA